jgi:hypothetical protein
LKARAVRFRPAILGMMACFAFMNGSFITVMTLTTAGNAIFLQYTAAVWIFLASHARAG